MFYITIHLYEYINNLNITKEQKNHLIYEINNLTKILMNLDNNYEPVL